MQGEKLDAILGKVCDVEKQNIVMREQLEQVTALQEDGDERAERNHKLLQTVSHKLSKVDKNVEYTRGTVQEIEETQEEQTGMLVRLEEQHGRQLGSQHAEQPLVCILYVSL